MTEGTDDNLLDEEDNEDVEEDAFQNSKL